MARPPKTAKSRPAHSLKDTYNGCSVEGSHRIAAAGAPVWFYRCVDKSQDAVFTEMASLTPSLATELLKQNDGNRHLKPTKTLQYAADMASGRWAFNGEPIIISKDGKLNDGQHRASAVVESGITVPALFVFGVDRETRTTVDQGAARTAGDYLNMEGIAYANNAAVAAKFILAYERADGRGIMHRQHITNAEVIERVRNDEKLREAASYAHRHIKSYRHLVSHSVVATCWYILSQIHPEDAARYMDQVTFGESIRRGDPAFAVRQAFLTEKRERAAAMEIIFQGWNKFRAKQPLMIVRSRGAFPVLV